MYTSPVEYHKYYVTAMCFVFRKELNQMLILSGDSSGDLVVSELGYSNKTFKIQSVNLLFRKKAHKNQITSIVPCSHDDVVLTSAQDGSIM